MTGVVLSALLLAASGNAAAQGGDTYPSKLLRRGPGHPPRGVARDLHRGQFPAATAGARSGRADHVHLA